MSIIKNFLDLPEGIGRLYVPHKQDCNLFICILCDKHSIKKEDFLKHFNEEHKIK